MKDINPIYSEKTPNDFAHDNCGYYSHSTICKFLETKGGIKKYYEEKEER